MGVEMAVTGHVWRGILVVMAPNTALRQARLALRLSQDEMAYQGAVYHGAIQLLLEPTGRKMTGKWVGFGRDFDLNTGPWTLELVTGTVTEETLKEYSKPADGD